MYLFGNHWRKIACAGFVPFGFHTHDIVTKDSETSQKSDVNSQLSETGWDRLRMIFTLDEFGSVSSEVNSIYQAGFLGFLVGAMYGGVITSRTAYMSFMENNEATAFKSHLDAKRKLQDTVTVNFAKGGFRWGWRIALFTTSYAGITTCMSVYRGKSSIYEYVTAGTVTGALYKINMGIRGMAVGGLLGSILGTVAGGCSLLILKLSGSTMEEVRYWQYKWKLDRDQTFRDGVKKSGEEELAIAKAHDEKVGSSKISLDDL